MGDAVRGIDDCWVSVRTGRCLPVIMGTLTPIDGGKGGGKDIVFETELMQCGKCGGLFNWQVQVGEEDVHYLGCAGCSMLHPLIVAEVVDMGEDE